MKKRRTFDAWNVLSCGLKVYIDGSYDPDVEIDDMDFDIDFQCPECDKYLELEYDDLSEDVKNEIHILAEAALKQRLIAERYDEYN